VERHASLPLEKLHRWGDAVKLRVAELLDWEVVPNGDFETWERD
jgi:hypothetical protein